MALNTTLARNTLSDAYKANITHAALYTTVPGATAGTEVTGGSYVRKAVTWGTSTNGVVSGTCTFDVPAGQTIAGWGGYTAIAGTYFDGGSLTSQAFATAGQYTLTVTYTQT